MCDGFPELPIKMSVDDWASCNQELSFLFNLFLKKTLLFPFSTEARNLFSCVLFHSGSLLRRHSAFLRLCPLCHHHRVTLSKLTHPFSLHLKCTL
jgi:hypothetical protein